MSCYDEAMRGMFARTVALALLAMPTALHAEIAATTDGAITYTVRKGDTLWSLTRTYLNRMDALPRLQTANKVRIPRHMPVGFQLAVPRDLLRFEPIVLRLSSFSGPVSGRADGRELQLAKGGELVEGTELTTGANGFVLITGSDGSRLALPSNTAIRIGRSRRYLLMGVPEIEVSVLRGRTEVKAAKQPPQGQFRVRSPISVSAVRGTVFGAGFDPAATLGATEVIEGVVAVASPVREIPVEAGFGATTNAAGELSREGLLKPPALLEPGKVQTEEKVALALNPVEGARSYRFQIGRDAAMEDVIAEVESTDPRAEFSELRNGTFFVRASAVSRSGLQGFSGVESFRRQRVGLAADIGQVDIPGAIRINWRVEGEGASLFRFQLFGEADKAQPLVDEAGLSTPGMTLTGLRRGTYQWRVGVIQTTPEGSAEVWTPLGKFTVNN